MDTMDTSAEFGANLPSTLGLSVSAIVVCDAGIPQSGSMPRGTGNGV